MVAMSEAELDSTRFNNTFSKNDRKTTPEDQKVSAEIPLLFLAMCMGKCRLRKHELHKPNFENLPLSFISS